VKVKTSSILGTAYMLIKALCSCSKFPNYDDECYCLENVSFKH
jgi:hypothetical protein